MAGAKLDHLAVAAESWDDLWPRYRADLGGEWVSGEQGFGFSPAQVRFANGMKVEVLAPHRWEHNDFLRRFLDHRGPGAHHVTFKVPDIKGAITDARSRGYEPVGIDLRDPNWKEAFLHPKDGPGIVVQLAQAKHEWDTPPPTDFPPAEYPQATLDYVGLAVADIAAAHALFARMLNGEETCHGWDDTYEADWFELSWETGGRIRLYDLGESGLHHVAFSTPNAADVPDAKQLDDDRWEISPEANLGVRLTLTST